MEVTQAEVAQSQWAVALEAADLSRLTQAARAQNQLATTLGDRSGFKTCEGVWKERIWLPDQSINRL